jgi:two-component system invasion response regulator UvrY
MGDKRLERLGKPQFLKRGRAQVREDAPVLALERLDLGLDRARRRASGGIVANLLREDCRAGAQCEEMGPEFVMEFVGDCLTIPVVGVEDPLHQFAVGAVQAAEHHPIIISGCRALLETDRSREILEAWNGPAGFAAFFDSRPDVALIDINLPGLSGLELLRRILQRAPEARLIIFNMNDDPVVAPRAIEAGATGYIAKNDDPALFAEAVRAVANGGLYLHPEMARQIAFLRAGANANMISTLSQRELEILHLVAAGRIALDSKF